MGCLSTELGRAIPPATTYDIVMARHSAEAGGKSFPVPLKLLVGTRGKLLMLGSGSAAVQQCSSMRRGAQSLVRPIGMDKTPCHGKGMW